LESEFDLGSIVKGIGGLLGESEFEGEFELEGEYEGEEFLGNIARGIGRFVRRAAPILRRVAKVAAPIAGTALLGPLGGVVGRVAASALESEYEFELEGEGELELEGEMEFEAEGPISQQEALAELMADVAARAHTEVEAEAMIGAATVTVLSPSDRAALQSIIPHLVRATSILTRILRTRRATRPAVRTVPTVVKRTARTLKRQAAAGKPVTRKTAAKVMAAHTRRVIGNPNICAGALKRNVRATHALRRPAGMPRMQRARQRVIAG
jgi:hypothetical protein